MQCMRFFKCEVFINFATNGNTSVSECPVHEVLCESNSFVALENLYLKLAH